jgi:ammonium transporter, Amt family
VGAFAVMIYSFVISLVIGYIVKAVTGGGRVTPEAEATGIDETEHAETGYDFSSHRSLAGIGTSRPAAAATASAEQVPATAGKES